MDAVVTVDAVVAVDAVVTVDAIVTVDAFELVDAAVLVDPLLEQENRVQNYLHSLEFSALGSRVASIPNHAFSPMPNTAIFVPTYDFLDYWWRLHC